MQRIHAVKTWMVLFLFLFFLSGCATPESEITKTYDIRQDSYEGHNILVLILDADVESKSTIRQDAKTDARTKLDAALAQNGSTQQNARESAGSAMDGIKSILDATKKTVQTDSNNNNSRTEAIQQSPVPAVLPVSELGQPAATVTGVLKTETHDGLKIVAGKKHSWLDVTGAYYGKNIVFKWPGCEDLVVPDGAKTHGRDGNTSNHWQAFFFSGTDQKDHRTYEGHPDYEDASVFADPGCGADSVTVSYHTSE